MNDASETWPEKPSSWASFRRVIQTACGREWMGAPCTICGEPVTPDQVEYEVEFAHEGAIPGLDKYHVHLRCFAAWEFERTKLD